MNLEEYYDNIYRCCYLHTLKHSFVNIPQVAGRRAIIKALAFFIKSSAEQQKKFCCSA